MGPILGVFPSQLFKFLSQIESILKAVNRKIVKRFEMNQTLRDFKL